MGTFFTMSIISLFSITSFLFLEALLEICSAVHIQFIALDRPCLEKYRLCSTHCSVSQLRGDFNCQFCVCDDPKYEIAWPTSTTTAVPLTSTSAPRHTDRPGEWTVNNITYSKLRNPCYQTEANCPVNCKSYNETKTGTTALCSRCRCPIDAFNFLRPDEGFGRRRSENIREMSRDISMAKKVPVKRNLRNMCMPLFSCPIKRCQSGQTFQLTTLGCPICQCVPIAEQVTTTLSPTTLSPSSISSSKLNTNPHFLSLFCKVEPDGCPFDCNVVDYRVGSWHCYHCNCPANSYTALVNPCKDDKYLCPTHCTVRDLTDSRDSSIVCQYCDCGGHYRQRPHTIGKIIKRRRKSALSPFEICKHNCYEDYCRRNMCGHCPVIPFIRPPYVGRRKRQGLQGPVQCGKCVHCMVPPPAKFHAQTNSPIPQTTNHVQSVGTPTHKVEISDEHCLSAELSIFCPARCSSIHVSKCYYCNCNGGLLSKTFIRHVLGGIGSHLGKPAVHASRAKTTQTTTAATYTTLPLVYTTPKSTFLPSKSTHRPTHPTTPTTQTTVPTTTIRTSTLPTTIKTMPPTTNRTTSTLPTTIQTMSPKPDSCYLCSGLSCSEKDVHICPSGQDYCMNTIDQDNQGERNITRACVTEDDCYNKWWIVSADSPTCLSMKNDINGPSGSPEICHFCCKGSLCNKQGRIPDGDLYKGESHPSSGIITIG